MNSIPWRVVEQEPVERAGSTVAGGVAHGGGWMNRSLWMNSRRWRLEEVDGG